MNKFEILLNNLRQNKFLSDTDRVNPYSMKNFANHKDLLQQVYDITSFLTHDASINERFFCIVNKLSTQPTCAQCGDTVNYSRNNKKYAEFCSRSCMYKSKEWLSRIQETNKQKYGGVSPLNNKDIQQKVKNTNLERHGVEYPAQNKEIFNKVRQTNLERYKHESPLSNIDIQQKVKQTMLERHGVEFPIQNEEIHNKMKQTLLDNYGVEHPIQSEEIHNKMKQTNLSKYNSISPFGDSKVQQKIKQTNLERYGFENPIQNEEIHNKMKQTNLERYGFENALCNEEVKEKIKQKYLKNHGVEHYMLKHISSESLEKLNNKEWLENEHYNKELSQTGIARNLNVSPSYICALFEKYNIITKNFQISAGQKEVQIFIENITDYEVLSNYKLTNKLELDIFVPELNLAIEYNGIYWHSELAGRNKKYHLYKQTLCEEKGIRLIQILEPEWFYKRDIVESRLLSLFNQNEKIYARKCIIKTVDKKIAKHFINKTHIQGSVNSSIYLGLYYNQELVSVMSFGKSRFNKEYEYELLRYSSKLNTNIIGGASRLFTYFIRNYSPNSVITYSDNRWNTGRMYEKLGFKFVENTNPNYKYFLSRNTNTLHSRNKFQKHKLEKILDQFNPKLTEWENMQNNGYNRIWDCGNKKWTWKI